MLETYAKNKLMSMKQMLRINPTLINGVSVIDTNTITDSRGGFLRAFCINELAPVLGSKTIKQINISNTKEKGSFRGLHFQRQPACEIKFVRCLKGRVWDIALDLRKGSQTFLKYFCAELSSENKKMMVLPEGVAHGFQTLDDECELLYLHTEVFSPQLEDGVRWNDPMIQLKLPLSITQISKKDETYELLSNNFDGIAV